MIGCIDSVKEKVVLNRLPMVAICKLKQMINLCRSLWRVGTFLLPFATQIQIVLSEKKYFVQF